MARLDRVGRTAQQPAGTPGRGPRAVAARGPAGTVLARRPVARYPTGEHGQRKVDSTFGAAPARAVPAKGACPLIRPAAAAASVAIVASSAVAQVSAVSAADGKGDEKGDRHLLCEAPGTDQGWSGRSGKSLCSFSAVAVRPGGGTASTILPSGKQYRLARHWGPERIETGWWRGQSAGRDYFRVETATGSRYWLFRRLRDGKWFLHGTFE